MSKNVGGAVVRNTVKRRLRAQASRLLPTLPPGVDVVVRAQPEAAERTSAELGADLERLLRSVLPRVSRSLGEVSVP